MPDQNQQSSAHPAPEIRGILERITFHNQENGYTVARLREEGAGRGGRDKGLTTVVGHLSGVPIGSTLNLTGSWIQDPRFGRQFKISSYEILKPNSLNGIERYLGSGLIKGIGPKFAARIVKRFGLATLDVLESDPDRLAEVSGLGAKRIEQIKQAWLDHKEIHQIMIFLQGHGISATYAVKIYKTYKNAALKVVKENPYRLAEEIWGIGFRVADDIAQSLGVPANDPRRVRAGLLFALNEAAGNGHCFLPREKLLSLAGQLLKLSPETPALQSLIEEQVPALTADKKIVGEDNNVYLLPLYFAEKAVAQNLLALKRAAPSYNDIKTEPALKWAEDRLQLSLAPEQRAALKTALEHKVSILTGGPGTGKSTILKGLILMLAQKGVSVLLAAPTGRAAKRLSEATGREAKTVHRLLEFDPAIMGFKRNSRHPLRADLVIIDEASMLDIMLASSLIKAVAPASSLLLVGDADQLPSVGPGNVLQDIISSGRFPVVRLHKIFRQGPGSLISINASLINQGKFIELLPDYEGDKDFYCIFRDNPDEIEAEILSLCQQRLPRKYRLDPVRDIQVLAPMRKGLIGTDNLNARLQELLNPDATTVEIRSHRFRVGDKVMQVRNNYDKDVYNGDLGFIKDIKAEELTMTADFEGRSVVYEQADLDELVLAYATTVHKAQGSEFPCLIMPVHTSHFPLLQRNLLYTAITRGKKVVILVGSKKAINIAIRNNRVHNRNSRLRERLSS